MNLADLIKAKEEQRTKLITRSKESTDVAELRSINEQLDSINNDLNALRAMQKQEEEQKAAENRSKEPETVPTQKANTATEEGVSERTKAVNEHEAENRSKIFTPGVGFSGVTDIRDNVSNEAGELEKRGKTIREGRSITIASSNIIIPSHDSNTITDHFNVVSSLIDNVAHLDFNGGDTFKQPFAIDTPAGDYTAEGAAYTAAESTFGQAAIYKSKVTAISDYSEELEKLPAAPYAQYIQNSIRNSIRRKLTREILIGDGSDGHLTGIFSTAVATKTKDSAVPIIDSSKDLSFSKIDDTTLDEIVFNFGGDEDVEGTAVLILNKADLLAFSKVRTSTKQRFYDIKAQGNYGTINGIPYIINSACTPISGGTANSGKFAMAYGNLMNYSLVTFSNVEIRKSYDVQFKEGMISVRGSGFFGGNVVRQNGFVRVKVAASA